MLHPELDQIPLETVLDGAAFTPDRHKFLQVQRVLSRIIECFEKTGDDC